MARGQRRGELDDSLSAKSLASAFHSLTNGTIINWLYQDPGAFAAAFACMTCLGVLSSRVGPRHLQLEDHRTNVPNGDVEIVRTNRCRRSITSGRSDESHGLA